MVTVTEKHDVFRGLALSLLVRKLGFSTSFYGESLSRAYAGKKVDFYFLIGKKEIRLFLRGLPTALSRSLRVFPPLVVYIRSSKKPIQISPDSLKTDRGQKLHFESSVAVVDHRLAGFLCREAFLKRCTITITIH